MKLSVWFCLFLIGMCSIGAVSINGIHSDNTAEYYFRYFNLIEARMESPSLIIYMDSPMDLTRKATELNTMTIYDTAQGLVVLDTQNSIAYLLCSQITWYGVHLVFGILFTVISGILLSAFMVYKAKKIIDKTY